LIQWCAGCQDAEAQLFHRFAHRLIALARSRLDGLTRQKVDPEDVVQSVWRSFFRRQAQGEFDLTSWDSLWGLLVVITLRKCGHSIEHFRAARRDVRREVAASDSVEPSGPPWEPLTREPTPVQAAILAETLQQLMARLDGRGRQVLALSLQGYTVAEISLQVGRTERTIRRLLAQVREWLNDGLDAENEP
jgi:RNA polymerase sigma-70 factor (ECF subfamily)